jgi:hypothetical protein
MAEPILAFKAGRAFRREGTNFVDADPIKGAIVLSRGDDDLLHFLWKNRTTDRVEEVRFISFLQDDSNVTFDARVGFDTIPH